MLLFTTTVLIFLNTAPKNEIFSHANKTLNLNFSKCLGLFVYVGGVTHTLSASVHLVNVDCFLIFLTWVAWIIYSSVLLLVFVKFRAKVPFLRHSHITEFAVGARSSVSARLLWKRAFICVSESRVVSVFYL